MSETTRPENEYKPDADSPAAQKSWAGIESTTPESKSWAYLTDAQKVERMRGIVKSHTMQITEMRDRLRRLERWMVDHHHTLKGDAAITLSHVEQAEPEVRWHGRLLKSDDDKDVYF
jgi:hypothetical protein